MRNRLDQFNQAARKQLTREAYLDLTGAELTPSLYEAPDFVPHGEPEQLDGYTRQKVSIRLFSDDEAARNHPEISVLQDAVREGKQVEDMIFNLPASDETLTEALVKYLDTAGKLIEDIQYGGRPYSYDDLKQLKAVGYAAYPDKEKFTRIPSLIENVLDKTLRFYTHTEAYILTPDNLQPGETRPAILMHHQHNAEYDLGKGEPAGVCAGAAPNQATGVDLVKQGYIVVAHDLPGFESRQHPVRTGLQWERWRSHGMEQAGNTLLGMHLEEGIKMVSFAESLPQVDKTRIGAYGHSLGSWVTANLAVIDDRIKVAVTNCGFPTVLGMNRFPAQYHCEPHSIPGIRNYANDYGGIFAVRETPLRLHMNFGGSDVLNNDYDLVAGEIREVVAANPQGGLKPTFFVDPLTTHKNTPAMLERTLATFGEVLGNFGPRPAPQAEPVVAP